MIVVSSDGTISIPYESYIFVVRNLMDLNLDDSLQYMYLENKYWVIVCVYDDGNLIVFDAYSSKEKAVAIMNILAKAYSNGMKVVQLRTDEDLDKYFKKDYMSEFKRLMNEVPREGVI